MPRQPAAARLGEAEIPLEVDAELGLVGHGYVRPPKNTCARHGACTIQMWEGAVERGCARKEVRVRARATHSERSCPPSMTWQSAVGNQWAISGQSVGNQWVIRSDVLGALVHGLDDVARRRRLPPRLHQLEAPRLHLGRSPQRVVHRGHLRLALRLSESGLLTATTTIAAAVAATFVFSGGVGLDALV